VGVDDCGAPLASDGAQLSGRPYVPFSAQRQTVGREASVLGSPDQGRTRWRDDKGPVAEIAESGRKQEYLALAAAPATPGVDVKNPG